MDNCVFCKIIKDEIKPLLIYEDKSVMAFLDVNPVSEGHTLIVPKEHYENIFDISIDVIKEVSVVAKSLAEKYKLKLGATGVNLLNASGKDAQQSVFHFHLHLVPRYKDDGMDLWFHNYSKKEIDLNKTLDKIKR